MADELTTANPDGVTTSNYPYWPRTQEQKAEAIGVPFATIANQDLDKEEPYPDGGIQVTDEQTRMEQLLRIHAPMELVEGKDMAEQQAKNLAAGGSVTHDDILAQVHENHGTTG